MRELPGVLGMSDILRPVLFIIRMHTSIDKKNENNHFQKTYNLNPCTAKEGMFIPLQKNDGYTVILKDGHFPEIWQLWQTHRLAQGIATGEKEPSTPQEARLAGLRVASRCLELPLGHHTGGLIRNGSRVRRL